MSRQSSSPDSLTFENIYQLPFFCLLLPPFLFRSFLNHAVAPQRQRVPNGELTDGEAGCLPEVLYGRPVCGPLNDYL